MESKQNSFRRPGKALTGFLMYAVLFIASAPVAAVPTFGQQASEIRNTVSIVDQRLDISLLQQIEARVLPPTIKDGPARFTELPDYYWAENRSLQDRLKSARDRYEKPTSKPFRALTLIAGSAGVGKTFIKRDIFSKDYPENAICKFDVKELFDEWRDRNLVEDRADLHFKDVVVCRLPAIKPGNPKLFLDYLESQQADFFVIDSLGEVHPDDYESLLRQVEQFVVQSDRPFLHVVVLGRPPAFRDYWRKKASTITDEPISLFMLQPPRFLTTGDLQVSSWNYHTWKYKLRWQSSDGEWEKMPLEEYSQWVQAGFPDTWSGRAVSYEPNANMDPLVRATVQYWARQYPVVNAMLVNLAGNGMAREVAESFAHRRRAFDERDVMEEFLVKWLDRDAHCENRPSSANPEHLELYMRLIEGVAAKYLREGNIDARGYFHVEDDEMFEIVHKGREMQFSVQQILDRSGLKYFDPRETGDTAYRFEPIWLHRLLVEKYNESSTAK